MKPRSKKDRKPKQFDSTLFDSNLFDFEKRKDELEKYRQLLDETLANLRKIYESKSKKMSLPFVIVGILLVAIGGVLVVYIPSLDILGNDRITLFGSIGIFIGLSIAFIGYLLAHKGFMGSWR